MMQRANSIDTYRKSRLKKLLGMTVAELESTIGVPYASYSYREEEVLLYEKAPVKNIALRKGVVVKCDAMIETRKNLRVKPLGPIPVIAYGNARSKGVIRDISVAGISISYNDDSIFRHGERVILSFLLPIDGVNRYLEIPCVTIATRVFNNLWSSVFLYDCSTELSLKRLISRYVSIRRVQNELGLDDSLLWGSFEAGNSSQAVRA